MNQVELSRLLDIVKSGHEKVKVEWMLGRITRLWPEWLNGLKKLSARQKLNDYPRKKVSYIRGSYINAKQKVVS